MGPEDTRPTEPSGRPDREHRAGATRASGPVALAWLAVPPLLVAPRSTIVLPEGVAPLVAAGVVVAVIGPLVDRLLQPDDDGAADGEESPFTFPEDDPDREPFVDLLEASPDPLTAEYEALVGRPPDDGITDWVAELFGDAAGAGPATGGDFLRSAGADEPTPRAVSPDARGARPAPADDPPWRDTDAAVTVALESRARAHQRARSTIERRLVVDDGPAASRAAGSADPVRRHDLPTLDELGAALAASEARLERAAERLAGAAASTTGASAPGALRAARGGSPALDDGLDAPPAAADGVDLRARIDRLYADQRALVASMPSSGRGR